MIVNFSDETGRRYPIYGSDISLVLITFSIVEGFSERDRPAEPALTGIPRGTMPIRSAVGTREKV